MLFLYVITYLSTKVETTYLKNILDFYNADVSMWHKLWLHFMVDQHWEQTEKLRRLKEELGQTRSDSTASVISSSSLGSITEQKQDCIGSDDKVTNEQIEIVRKSKDANINKKQETIDNTSDNDSTTPDFSVELPSPPGCLPPPPPISWPGTIRGKLDWEVAIGQTKQYLPVPKQSLVHC